MGFVCLFLTLDVFYHVTLGGRNAACFGQGVVPRSVAFFRRCVLCLIDTASRIYTRRKRYIIFICDKEAQASCQGRLEQSCARHVVVSAITVLVL